jgi:hypothetical protein
MDYKAYKQKHDWYDEQIQTLEGQLAEGKARLQEVNIQLEAYREESTRADAVRMNKSPFDETAAEVLRSETAHERVVELDKQRQDFETQNERAENGIKLTEDLRTELEAENPDHKEQYIQELETEMQKPVSEDPGIGKAGLGFQAWATGAAVAAGMNFNVATLPGDDAVATAYNPALQQMKEQAADLDFESTPSYLHEEMHKQVPRQQTTELVISPDEDNGAGSGPGDGPFPPTPPDGAGAEPPPPVDEPGPSATFGAQGPPVGEMTVGVSYGELPQSATPAPGDGTPQGPQPLAPPRDTEPLLITSNRENQLLLTDQRGSIAGPSDDLPPAGGGGAGTGAAPPIPEPSDDIPAPSPAQETPQPKNDIQM